MTVNILHGDCRTVLATLPSASVHCIVTSPPYYGLRDYGVDGQIGLEQMPDAYVVELIAVFREARRVLRDDGTLWLNLGDSYAGSGKGGNPDGSKWAGFLGNKDRENAAKPSSKAFTYGLKPKDLIGIPWMVAFALRADGWYLRQDIIWRKPNPMPESVIDRCTKAHEYVFMLSKSARYWYDPDSIAENARYPGDNRAERTDTRKTVDPYCKDNGSRAKTGTPTAEKINRRSVWTIATQPYSEAHFATMPPDLAELCIKAGCPKGETVLDPFGGAGTTGLVADRLGRSALLIELNPTYVEMARRRIEDDGGMFTNVLETIK